MGQIGAVMGGEKKGAGEENNRRVFDPRLSGRTNEGGEVCFGLDELTTGGVLDLEVRPVEEVIAYAPMGLAGGRETLVEWPRQSPLEGRPMSGAGKMSVLAGAAGGCAAGCESRKASAELGMCVQPWSLAADVEVLKVPGSPWGTRLRMEGVESGVEKGFDDRVEPWVLA